jgi:pimeloyl-ACP methyl ester carboxylesterase
VWVGLGVASGLAGLIALLFLALYVYLRLKYLGNVVRIFQEKPLLTPPRGQPLPGAEDVSFRAADGLTLHGLYLKTHARHRRGVILFGLEFGSSCWACAPYCDQLLENGFDIFTFESRNQGQSDRQPGYEPLQWVTNFEVMDGQAAIAYLRGRSDAHPRGVGFFGISKGGGAGLVAASRDPYVRCFVTDGVFATYTTMVPYMRKWVRIYNDRYWIHTLLPIWMYGLIGRTALRRIGRARGCRFPHLERAIARLSPRPLLMIHGGADTYIKPQMARALFERAGPPKAFWLVEGAKHNQALNLQPVEYQRRVLEFFETHLAESAPAHDAAPLVEAESSPAAARRPA